MRVNLYKIVLAAILVMAPGMACRIGAPAPTPVPQGNLETAVAQTVAAERALTPLVTEVVVVVTATDSGPVATQPLVAAPATTETLPAPSDTPLGPPRVSVTVNTNCRYGPGPDFHTVGALLVGETAEVFGENQNGDWWLIENLKRPGERCWLWGQYAQIAGDKSGIALATPPPVYFTAAYSSHADCEALGGVDTFAFSVQNIGSLALESATVTVVRKSDGASMMHPDFPFANTNAPFRVGICASGNSTLAPGAQALISVIAQTPFESTPARATIRICMQDGLGGTCYERTVEFTIG